MRTSIAVAMVLSLAACERTTEEPPDTGGRRDAGSDSGVPDAPSIEDDAPAPDGSVDCTGPLECWACEPTEPVHFLDGCTDATCEPFPITTARLPLLRADGSLPPLP